jgi:hypothetical protein
MAKSWRVAARGAREAGMLWLQIAGRTWLAAQTGE